jgi:hypothetical protein
VRQVAALLLAGAACSSPALTPDGGLDCAARARPDAGDFPPAVFVVLRDKCQTCHTRPRLNNAKGELLTWEDTQVPYGAGELWQRMAEVIEPDGTPRMPYGNAPQLTDAELATLRGWFGACALPLPQGDGCDALPDAGPESSACDAGR